MGNSGWAGYASPSRSIAIIELAENLEIIHGAQQLSGKILIRKELAAISDFCLHRFRLGNDLLYWFSGLGLTSHGRVISVTRRVQN